jgi:hypothetical protein
MSTYIRFPVRERWAARSVVVKKWIAKGGFGPGDPICEMEVDGVPSTFFNTRPVDTVVIYWYFVDVDQEVGAWGSLLECFDVASFNPEAETPLHRSARRRLVRRDRYPRIFINYRRDDADASAGRLHETLTRTFGRDEVFMDQFSIRPGEVFSWTIQQAVVHADVVVSLIGPRWWTLKDQSDTPRIASPRDYVRRELVSGLDRGTALLPVLVNGATLPDGSSRFDQELYGLEDLQFHQLSPRHWETDVEELIASIREHLAIAERYREQDAAADRRPRYSGR